ncbi:hypothetical protein IJG93_01465, partial [Candidatus Saccharibacteria bacterium]|nr:hypothetical protein [Candidatus Saccharibacteria bacterium]
MGLKNKNSLFIGAIFIVYDLVTKGTSGGECYGTYSGGTGSGAGYVNSCIHSGSNDYTSGNTVWYNYATATAGTVKNSSTSDTTGNIITATESVCPKGWTLPSRKQIDSIGSINGETGSGSGSSIYVPNFTPVIGGIYNNGVLAYESYGFWWGSTAFNTAARYYLAYDSSTSTLQTNRAGERHYGFYIRCVSEEKDVSDLTYMQDMTPSVAANTAEGTTASLTDRRDGKVYTV